MSTPIVYGVVNGFYECNMERMKNLIKDCTHEMCLQSSTNIVSSCFTKYAIMPILDRRVPTTVPFNNIRRICT